MKNITVGGKEVKKILMNGATYFEKFIPQLYAEYTTTANPTLVRTDFNSTQELKDWIENNKSVLKTLKAHRDKDFDIFPEYSPSFFFGCSSLTRLDLSSFSTYGASDLSSMFQHCSSLTEIIFSSSFDTSESNGFSNMFLGCSALTSLDLSSFNSSKVERMGGMFDGCSALTSLDLSSFNTSQVFYMAHMFEGCSSLTTLDVSSFDTSRVESMSNMFANCDSLTTLDLRSFDTSGLQDDFYDTLSMFQNCRKVTSSLARTQADADKFNGSTDRPYNVYFTVG